MASVVYELFSPLVKKAKIKNTKKGSSPCFIELFFEIASKRMSVSTLVTEKKKGDDDCDKSACL